MIRTTAQHSKGARRRRTGGRAAARPKQAIKQLPFAQPVNRFPRLAVVSEDELESVHQASLEILQEIGMDFLHEEARAMLKAAGADVDPNSDRVRFDPALIESYIGLAPKTFTLHAPNPAHSLVFGGDHMVFCTVGSPPNAFGAEHGRRPGNRHDFQNFVRLAHRLNAVHMFGGYPVEPTDVHASVRHLEAIYDFLTLSDKAIHAYSLGKERNLDAFEMIKIVRQIDHETLLREPSLVTIINTNSPLKLDMNMLTGIIEMARHNQITCVTPFTLAGAMAPVSLAGAVAQQNAEALAGLVMSQIARPGAPFIYGSFTSNVAMTSGAPAFGTPEYMKTTLLGGQLARRYGLPYRASNVNAANTLDAQAAYESVFSLWACVMGGVHMLKHAAGWMEGGLQASFEKMVLDADLLQMVIEFLKPLKVDDGELALDAIREVGPGGHFFGAAHTLARYENAFYQPMISDWRNFESWQEAGSPDAGTRAHELYKQLLADYEAPALDPAVREALRAFVDKRTEEGGAPTDY